MLCLSGFELYSRWVPLNTAVKTSPPQNNSRCFKLHRPLLICPHQMFTKRKKNRCHVFSSSINVKLASFTW